MLLFIAPLFCSYFTNVHLAPPPPPQIPSTPRPASYPGSEIPYPPSSSMDMSSNYQPHGGAHNTKTTKGNGRKAATQTVFLQFFKSFFILHESQEFVSACVCFSAI